jgi:hypothetical protein
VLCPCCGRHTHDTRSCLPLETIGRKDRAVAYIPNRHIASRWIGDFYSFTGSLGGDC